MINVPLAEGSDGAAAREAVEAQWLPALENFKPQMLFISAGFDAHREVICSAAWLWSRRTTRGSPEIDGAGSAAF